MAKTITLVEKETMEREQDAQLEELEVKMKELKKEVKQVKAQRFEKCRVGGCESCVSSTSRFFDEPLLGLQDINWTTVEYCWRDDFGSMSSYSYFCPDHRKEAEEYSKERPDDGYMKIDNKIM